MPVIEFAPYLAAARRHGSIAIWTFIDPQAARAVAIFPAMILLVWIEVSSRQMRTLLFPD